MYISVEKSAIDFEIDSHYDDVVGLLLWMLGLCDASYYSAVANVATCHWLIDAPHRVPHVVEEKQVSGVETTAFFVSYLFTHFLIGPAAMVPEQGIDHLKWHSSELPLHAWQLCV